VEEPGACFDVDEARAGGAHHGIPRRSEVAVALRLCSARDENGEDNTTSSSHFV